MKARLWLLPLWLLGCSSPDIEEGVNLESASVIEESLRDPPSFLLSQAELPYDSAQPLVVAVHGFSASTFEWREFRDYCDSLGSPRVSLPLLGGHGRQYEDFRRARWEDWQEGALAEYRALAALGFRNLNLVCSSTGCPLLLEALHRGAFAGLPVPRKLIMVDPILFPSSKLLSLVEIVGPVLGHVTTECTETEKAHWYCNRPQEALQELMELLTHVRTLVENRLTLPQGLDILLYKATQDPSADPVTALALWKGLRQADGERIDVRMVSTDLHVFTRGAGRALWDPQDEALQLSTFAEMRQVILCKMDSCP